MDLPAVLTGILRINQTVGKTQPAIPPLSRLNCHFISFIYGGSALIWTPPLSVLPVKMLLFFFFLPYKVLWQPIYTPVLLFSLFFPGKHSSSHTSSREQVPAIVKFVWRWRCEQPVIMGQTKGCTDRVVLWRCWGTDWAFSTRCSSANSSSSALPAESYLSWLSSSSSPLMSHSLSEKKTKNNCSQNRVCPWRKRKEFLMCPCRGGLAELQSAAQDQLFCQRWFPFLVGSLSAFCLKMGNKSSHHLHA